MREEWLSCGVSARGRYRMIQVSISCMGHFGQENGMGVSCVHPFAETNHHGLAILSWGWLQDVCASRFQLVEQHIQTSFPTPKNYFCQLNTPLPTLFIANCCTFLYHIMSKIQYTIYIICTYIYIYDPVPRPPTPPMVSPPTHIHTKTHICIPTYIHSCYIPAYIHACLPTYIHVYI